MEQKELLAELETMKKGLEDNIEQKANEVVTEQLKAVNDAIEELKAVKPEVTADELKAIKSTLDATVKAFELLQVRIKSGGNQPAPAKKSFNEVLTAAIEEKTDDFNKMARNEKGAGRIIIDLDLKTVGDITTGNVTGTTVWGAQYRPGIIEAPKRKVHMRDVMMGGNCGPGTDYYFMKQNGNGEGTAPAPVAESSAMAQTDEDLVESSVKIEEISGYERISLKALANVPGMTNFIQSRLIEKLLKAEDSAILYGDGSTPNPKGILVSGNYTASTSSASVLAEKITDDISYLEDTAERNADLILLRPADYYSFFKNKAGGSGEYDLPMNVAIVNGQLYINGIPVRATTALTAGDYIVGNFAEGANFLTQQNMRIEYFYQDGSNAVNRKVTVGIFETVALPVYGSDYFIKGAV